MTLQDVIHKYISWRRVQGAKFETEAVMLYVFARHVGGAIGCDTVTSAQVCNYLAGNGSLTRYRANKYGALKGFYVYAVSRGYPKVLIVADHFVGTFGRRPIDFLRTSITVREGVETRMTPEASLEVVRRFLRDRPTTAAWHLAMNPVIGLLPVGQLGEVVWSPSG